MRKRLASELARKGKFSNRLLQIIEELPRHYFLDSAFAEQAYEDKAFPIGSGQTISQPYTVAYQTELMNIQQGDKVLEIGTGSGYQAAILAMLGAQVYTIERVPELHERAKEVMRHLSLNIKFYAGDGTLGLPRFAPFDKIIVTAAAPEIPKALVDQLAEGGLLVIPVGNKDTQDMMRITRMGNGQYKHEQFDNFRFVPLIGKQGW